MNVAKKTVLAAALLLALPLAAHADQMFKSVTHTDAFTMQGKTQPAQTDTSVTWVSDDGKRMQSNVGDSVSYIFVDGGAAIHVLNNHEKTYVDYPFVGATDSLLAAIEKQQGPEAAQQFKAMMGMMKLEITVTPTDSTKTIGKYSCRKYNVAMGMGMMKSAVEMWATKDIAMSFDMFNIMSRLNMMVLPGFEQAMAEFKKIEGVPIHSVSTVDVMGSTVKSTVDLIHQEAGTAPAGSYEIPKDYTRQSMSMDNIM